MNKRLHRSEEGQMLCGVCSGLAEYSGNDVSIIRLLAVVLSLFSFGSAVLAYVILAVILPKE